MAEVSSTRLYLGNLPREATKKDVEDHFATHGTGKITEIKLMNGFGFIEYDDPMDARDVVPGKSSFHGSDFKGERLTVQFARGPRQREPFPGPERTAPRPRRTAFRMQISGLPGETSWQDLKDFARQSGLDVVYSETGRDRDGKGFVEFETAADLRTAVEGLDGHDFKGARVTCTEDVGFNPSVPIATDRAPRLDAAAIHPLMIMTAEVLAEATPHPPVTATATAPHRPAAITMSRDLGIDPHRVAITRPRAEVVEDIRMTRMMAVDPRAVGMSLIRTLATATLPEGMIARRAHEAHVRRGAPAEGIMTMIGGLTGDYSLFFSVSPFLDGQPGDEACPAYTDRRPSDPASATWKRREGVGKSHDVAGTMGWAAATCGTFRMKQVSTTRPSPPSGERIKRQ
ncbi:MAG: hypothetical protein M1817_002984 [Caeruleum heppii]|nr:MAG: hypothetical protein M1817_002984 [Caeruleum heppii]